MSFCFQNMIETFWMKYFNIIVHIGVVIKMTKKLQQVGVYDTYFMGF